MRIFSKASACFLMLILVLGWGFPLEAAKKKNKNFTPKEGSGGIEALFLGKVTKRFVVNSSTPQVSFDRIAKIEKAEVVVDEGGRFPSNDVLTKATKTGKPLHIVIPSYFQNGHKRRLEKLQDFTLIIRANRSGLSKEEAMRIRSLGPYRKVVEVDADDVSKKFIKNFKHLKQFDLYVRVKDKLSSGTLKLLKRAKAGKICYLLPESFSSKQMKKLAKGRNRELSISLSGNYMGKTMTRKLKKLKKVNVGFVLPGVPNSDEAGTFMSLSGMAYLTFTVGERVLDEDFVSVANSGL